MNAKCRISGHDWQKVYPDQELVDSIVFEQDIEEIHVCRRCRKMKRVAGTIGKLKDKDR